jgi:hypothetical protein
MNEARRERIRELIRTLERAGEQVQALLIDEEEAFECRSAASRETELGNFSEDAVRRLDEARTHIQDAIEEMQSAIGDDSLPEPIPTPAPMRRRF